MGIEGGALTMPSPDFIYIAGPCVLEDTALAVDIAGRLKDMAAAAGVRYWFKASYDKANRTSLDAYRGPGIENGLTMLAEVKRQVGVPVLSDIHAPGEAAPAAEVLDVLQIPAFLCRQTDLLVAAAQTGKIVNVKKGQFVAPEDMRYAVDKLRGSGAQEIWLTERGSTFGYHNLVVDFRSFTAMRAFGCPVIFDATHAVQIPSQGGASSGDRRLVPPLARAAAAYGIDGLFTEVYPNPDEAQCDGPNSIALATVPALLDQVLAARASVSEPGY
jgi:2-dehydro-3-deoxyphosphooctonate aldolase (KDO 8-P synthase)